MLYEVITLFIPGLSLGLRRGGVVFKVFDVGGDTETDTFLIRGSEGADDYRVSTIRNNFV